jgi:hypothetical protein
MIWQKWRGLDWDGCTMLPHRNIHKYTWASPDGKTHNQIDRIVTDRQRHSSVLDVRSFRATDCDTDHYLVVAKVRERLAVNKQGSRRFHTEMLNFNKLYEVETKRSILLRCQTGLQLCKIRTLKRKLILSGKQLEKISKFQLKKKKHK